MLMKSFALNTGPKQYNWRLPDIKKGARKEEVANALQIPRPWMLVK